MASDPHSTVRGEPEHLSESDEPFFNWHRASWGAVVGMGVFVFAYLASDSLTSILAVPFAALLVGLKPKWAFRVLSGGVTLLLVLGVWLQLAVIHLDLHEPFRAKPYGSWEGMGEAMVSVMVIMVVTPLTFVIALIKMCVTVNRGQKRTGDISVIALCLLAMALSAFTYFGYPYSRHFPPTLIEWIYRR
jgi:hypothetical protein